MEKREIQEGLIRACNIIDLIIEILRGSKDRAMVKNCLTDGVTTGIKFRSKESAILKPCFLIQKIFKIFYICIFFQFYHNTNPLFRGLIGNINKPSVLPCRFPNLLVNGSEGIAVGMATSIPPHNLGEVIEAILSQYESPL